MTRWYTAGAAALTATLALTACSSHHRPVHAGQDPRPAATVLSRARAAMASTSYTFTLSGSEVGTPKPSRITGQGRVSNHRLIGTFATGGSTVGALVATYVVTGRLDRAGLAALGFSTGEWADGSMTLQLDTAYHVTRMVIRGVGRTPTAKLTQSLELSRFGTTPAVPAQPPGR